MASPKESPNSEEKQSTAEKEKWTRLSVNLNPEVGEIFRTLVEEKGLTITEGIRTAIKVWKFIEDESAQGNQIAVIEPDKSVHKIYLI